MLYRRRRLRAVTHFLRIQTQPSRSGKVAAGEEASSRGAGDMPSPSPTGTMAGETSLTRVKVRQELNMTPESVQRDVQHIKSWLRSQPNLPPLTGVDEEYWIENYLILNKGRVERAITNLDLYFKCRTVLSEIFADRDPYSDAMQNSYKATCLAMVPRLTDKGHRIWIYSHFTSQVSAFDPLCLGKRLFAMIDIYLYEGIDRTGTVIICDLANTRLGHLTRYPLKIMKKAFDYGWAAYPERIPQIHIINPPAYLAAVMAFIRPFLKEKMRNRIKVHSKLNSLYQMIPRTHLPSDYGGECASLKELNDDWIKKMIAYRDWLYISGNQHKAKEPEKPSAKNRDVHISHDETEHFNISFKNLVVD